MERVFTENLKKQLQKRIKGDISVHVIDDILVIDIRPVGLHLWRYTISNIAEQMSIGLTSRIVSDVIVKQYKKYILSRYFHTK